MAFPELIIDILPNGDSRLEGMEKSDVCGKISELAKQAGKIKENQKKDHVPVYQSVNQKA